MCSIVSHLNTQIIISNVIQIYGCLLYYKCVYLINYTLNNKKIQIKAIN